MNTCRKAGGSEESYPIGLFRCIARVYNAGIKAALGQGEADDKLLDEMFYEYNDRH